MARLDSKLLFRVQSTISESVFIVVPVKKNETSFHFLFFRLQLYMKVCNIKIVVIVLKITEFVRNDITTRTKYSRPVHNFLFPKRKQH